MPLYNYRCSCGHTEEVVIRRGIDTLTCPACGGEAVRQFPTRFRVVTDREYHLHTPTLAEQFKGRKRELGVLMQKARAAGISVSENDSYDGSIAREALDPQAVVPHDSPGAYVRKMARQRHDQRKRDFDMEQKTKKPPLAPDVVNRLMHSRVKANPDLAGSKQRLKKLREDVINRHAPAT